MIEGELTVQGPDGIHTYAAGSTFVERPGAVYAAFNLSGAPASLVVTYVVPQGVPVTTLIDK